MHIYSVFLALLPLQVGCFLLGRLPTVPRPAPVQAPAASYSRRGVVRMMSNSKIKPFDWLEEVQRKVYEVRKLESSPEGQMLMSRLRTPSPTSGWRVGRALKRSVGEPIHKVSVIAEIKRRTPTGAETPTELAVIPDAGLAAVQLWQSGADVVIVNTDGPCYGGSMEDLVNVRTALTDKSGERVGPPVVAKDLYIHPVQLAEAASKGADGVVLIACLLGGTLNEMLDAAVMLGIEALVEVHTPSELKHALDLGATNILATNWDRIENELYPGQARSLKYLIPDLIVAIAAGGIEGVTQAGELADAGYDSVVLGRGLSSASDVEALISAIRDRQGMPSLLTGTGWSAEDYNRDMDY